MKKLAIFLILFIFSMPAFAQDKSSFTENFSLIRDSGANRNAFFNSNILCPDNYLFFAVNKRYSRQHREFQIFRFHQFLDRASLSRVATLEDGRQNWGDRHNLLYGQQEYVNSEEKSESLALGYLRRFAWRNKKIRKTKGTVALAGGPVLFVIGYALLSSAEEEENWFEGMGKAFGGAMLIGMGVISVPIGALTLAIPSSAERELDDVLSISDPGHRERASHEALSSLSARGRRRRILESVGLAAVSVYFLVGYPEQGYILAANWGGLAIYNAERAFQSYLKEKELPNKLEFRLGIMPYGGVKVGFVYSF
jgi:hypothetical protein